MKYIVIQPPPIEPPKTHHLELTDDEMECVRRWAEAAAGTPRVGRFLDRVGNAYNHNITSFDDCFK